MFKYKLVSNKYFSQKKGELIRKMIPDRLNFLDRFDNLYRVIVNAVKEDKLNERDFYIIIIAKAKSMDQERRERTPSLNEESD